MNHAGWKDSALKQLSVLAHSQDLITSDDLHDRVAEPPHHNQIGDAIRTAVEMKVLIPTGHYVQSRRRAAKKRTIKLFKSGFRPVAFDADPVSTYSRQREPQPLQGALL